MEQENSQELTQFDQENKAAILAMVPAAMQKAIDHAIHQRPDLFAMDERELYKHLKSDNRMPSPTDNRLRLKFWTEYDRATAAGKSFNLANVYSGICSRELFYKVVMERPTKLAWIMCPPVGYMVKAEEALEFGLDQLRDILEQDHGTGANTNVKLAGLKAKIVLMLDQRVKGAVVQKMMNLNVNTSNTAVAAAAANITMEELERQLKDLRRKDRQSQNLPVVEAEVVDDEKV